MIINKIYRKIFEKKDWTLSKIRKIHLKLKYPSISICKKTHIGKGCSIICMDNSTLELNNVHISDYVKISSNHGALVKITNGFIGSLTTIVARKEIIIESNFSIAEMVVIRDQNHNFNFSDTLVADQGYECSPILIKENVWIGAKATVLKGVSIEKNTVIAAHSLVNKNAEKNSLYAGTPARKVKTK